MANKKLSATITIGGAVASSLKSAFGSVKGGVNEVGSAIRYAERQQKLLSRSIQTFGKQGRNVDGLRQKYVAITSQIDRLREAHQRLNRIRSQQRENGADRRELGGKIANTATAGAAIALPSFAMFKQSSQFSYDLMMIGLTAEMTKKQVAELGGTMVTLSDQTGVSQENMKNAFGFLVAAGQGVGEAQENLKSIGKTAKATGSDIEDVARASFTMGDALKVKPDSMLQALDMLVTAGKEGKFEFKAMAAELPGLGSSFQALQMTGTEAVATMGSALQIAIKGAKSESEAANNMSNFLAKLMTEETAKKAAKMGGNISKVIRDAQAAGANPIEAAIAEISRITKGGDQELITKLFGDMQVQNFIRPMLQNLEEYQKIKQKVLASQGVVERDWATVMASSKEKTEGLSNSVWGLTKAIGGALDPTVGKLVDKLTPVVQATRDFVTANPKLVGGVIMAAGAFTTMRLAVLATKFAFTFLKGGMLSIVGLFYKTSAAATVAGVGSTAAAGGLTVLGKAFRFVGRAIIWMGRALLMNPIGLAITAIAGLAYVVYENWDTLKPFFTALWDDIVGKFDYAVKKIKSLIDDIKKRWEGLKTLVSGGVGSAWNSTVNTVTSAGNKIGDAWEKTKSWAGFSSGSESGVNTAAPLPNPSLPPLPKIAGSKRSTTITNHNQYDLTINAPPGADPKEIAREAVKELKRQQGISARSMMPDGYVFQG
ncbi:phage tail tape measure protein [Aeromonas sp.]|uniref:phage tail tape measure protein n=1 Tax=Aeromonas sp. TaxID=647 RepID=UPI0025908544|nr:phage tail tape measure protein [Aeromonas sp.]MCX7132426.1 phage tail tape measure protein [Aeromonas sp.]